MPDQPEQPKDRDDQTIATIVVDRDLCIGAGSCSAIAPEVFELDGENKAVVKNPKGADDGTIRLAAKSCPVFAILLANQAGKQLYPEDDASTGGHGV